jgi:hypothetical protein
MLIGEEILPYLCFDTAGAAVNPLTLLQHSRHNVHNNNTKPFLPGRGLSFFAWTLCVIFKYHKLEALEFLSLSLNG